MIKSFTLENMKVRRLLMKSRKEKITLKKANILDIKSLQKLLQEMFLEPIEIAHIEFFYKEATRKGYSDMNRAFEELEKRHRKEPNRRFLNLVLTL